MKVIVKVAQSCLTLNSPGRRLIKWYKGRLRRYGGCSYRPLFFRFVLSLVSLAQGVRRAEASDPASSRAK